jgi:catechol 2,3-dioxygenase-like lactoylglutathione lyase family enzyme
MTSRLTEVIVDCHDLTRLADFWCGVLGYERTSSGDGWLAIAAPGGQPSVAAWRVAAQPPVMAFVLVPEARSTKNRVHVDVTPIDVTQADEVQRLIGLGATPADVGQSDTAWIVMADPEGNEFCVMPAAMGEE